MCFWNNMLVMHAQQYLLSDYGSMCGAALEARQNLALSLLTMTIAMARRIEWHIPGIYYNIPDPAVSVPSAKLTRPAATAAAEPEDDPPGTNRSSKALGGVP